MQVRNAMTRKVTAARTHTTIRQIASKLLERGFKGVPIVDIDRKVIGVVTEADVIKAINNGENLITLTAEQIMTKPPICIDVHASMKDAINMMVDNDVTGLPVIYEGKLEGIISGSDIMRAMLKEKGYEPFVEYEYFMDRGT